MVNTGLKKLTTTGIFWTSIESFSNQGINFLINIFLARLLLPEDFGLVAIISIFSLISQTIISSGLGTALIRKKECSQVEYSTVFLYNVLVSFLIYLLLFYFAPLVSWFYDDNRLTLILRVISLDLIINSFGVIQNVILSRNMDFKKNALIVTIAGILSGMISVLLAIYGYGVFSLIIRSLSYSVLFVMLLWFFIGWRPKLIFSYTAFRELFGFGNNILISSLLNTFFNSLTPILIGKFYTPSDLGYFTRANLFKDLLSQKIYTIFLKVSYPLLSKVQDNISLLKGYYKRLNGIISFISFNTMFFLFVFAEPIIHILLGKNWTQSIAYLKILTFLGMLYPLEGINLNLLKVLGRADLFMKLQLLKNILLVLAIVFGLFFNIKVMIIFQIIVGVISYLITGTIAGNKINYAIREQISDLVPLFLSSLVFAITMELGSSLLLVNSFFSLSVVFLFSFIAFILLNETIKLGIYIQIRNETISILRARLFACNKG